MIALPRKLFYAVEAVLYIAYNAKAGPIAGNDIAAAQNLPTRLRPRAGFFALSGSKYRSWCVDSAWRKSSFFEVMRKLFHTCEAPHKTEKIQQQLGKTRASPSP